MLIACVKTGDKFGDDYVLKLHNGVKRYLREPFEFVCLTDRPVEGIASRPLPADLPGWWAKLGLFKLRQPLLYFDLDMVITGSLIPLLEWDGFGIIKDAWLPTYNSSVMKLTGNEGHVWDNFTPDVMRRCRMGDQQWITEQMPGATTFPVEWFPSFKAHGVTKHPDKALACNFHGEPKPHQFLSGWVKEAWV